MSGKRVVAVTGGAGALGSELARVLAKRGDAIAIFDTPRAKERAEALAKEIGGYAHTSDFASTDDFRAAIDPTAQGRSAHRRGAHRRRLGGRRERPRGERRRRLDGHDEGQRRLGVPRAPRALAG